MSLSNDTCTCSTESKCCRPNTIFDASHTRSQQHLPVLPSSRHIARTFVDSFSSRLEFLLYHSQTLPPGHCCWPDDCHVDDQTSVLNSLVNIFARLRHNKTRCTTDSTVNGPSDASHQYHQGCQKRFDVWAFYQAYRVPGGLADDQRTGVEAYPCSEQTSL